MSTQRTEQPSAEQIRAARHQGFDDSIRHMPDERRERLTTAHRVQDARRESNITNFYDAVLGDDD